MKNYFVVLAAISLAFCSCNRGSDEEVEEKTNPKEYAITLEQMTDYIILKQQSIERINLQLQSDTLNPEERHELMLLRSNINNEIKELQQLLR